MFTYKCTETIVADWGACLKFACIIMSVCMWKLRVRNDMHLAEKSIAWRTESRYWACAVARAHRPARDEWPIPLPVWDSWTFEWFLMQEKYVGFSNRFLQRGTLERRWLRGTVLLREGKLFSISRDLSNWFLRFVNLIYFRTRLGTSIASATFL